MRASCSGLEANDFVKLRVVLQRPPRSCSRLECKLDQRKIRRGQGLDARMMVSGERVARRGGRERVMYKDPTRMGRKGHAYREIGIPRTGREERTRRGRRNRLLAYSESCRESERRRNEGRDFDSGPAVNSCGRAWRALFGKKDGSGRRG